MSDDQQPQQPAPQPVPGPDPGRLGTETVIRSPDGDLQALMGDPGRLGTTAAIKARSRPDVERRDDG